jgi:four helix bundle protein
LGFGTVLAEPFRMSRDHTKLRSFQLADALVLDIYKETKEFPPEERYGLQAQVRRAAVSVPTNLVEGSARRGEVEYLNFCNIACASAFETRYLLDLSFRLGILSPRAHDVLNPRMTHLCKSLVRLVLALEQEAGVPATRRPKA